ncbi:polysaccharide deacetylase family protein [Flavobacteriaceae bacterium]|nr:polysaccharide deacetylase family protein [Flavobacteriaceae bacterium]
MKLLIYTHKITPRVRYVFKHICTRILGIQIDFTSVIEEFIAHQGLKLSYAKQPLGNELFIKSHYLLFEEGISDIEIVIKKWNDTKCFFPCGSKSSMPYDIFAASFYLLSRYEEYLPYVADDFGRFPPEESIAYQYHFLKEPVIDVWAYSFKAILQERFTDYEFVIKKFELKPIIDVPVVYKYSHKGLIRTIGGTFKDLINFNFLELYNRYLVLSKLRKDPYDTFKWLINNHKKRNLKPIFFFLLADYSKYDKSISYQNKHLVALIKSVSDYFDVGLKGSYLALDDKEVLKEEKSRFEAIFNISLTHTKNSFSKLKLPLVYRNLIDLEITSDYSMGYVSESGFRAGTCTPFYFYDLDFEMQTPLKINSFCVLDYVYNKKNANIDEIKQLIDSVKKVNGTFNLVLHNYTFSEDEYWQGWKRIYVDLLEYSKQS